MKSSKVLRVLLLFVGGAAAAQDIPNFSPHAMRRYQMAAPTPAPQFSTTAFRVEEYRAFRAPNQFQFQPPAEAPRGRARSIPMLKSLQRNRLVATLAGSVPALASAFDEDAPQQRRFSVGPLIDLDDARVGVRVRIRFGN